MKSKIKNDRYGIINLTKFFLKKDPNSVQELIDFKRYPFSIKKPGIAVHLRIFPKGSSKAAPSGNECKKITNIISIPFAISIQFSLFLIRSIYDSYYVVV